MAQYNAGAFAAIQVELMGPVELERFHKAPAWVRSVITKLLHTILKSRGEIVALADEVRRLREVAEAAQRYVAYQAREDVEAETSNILWNALRTALDRLEGK